LLFGGIGKYLQVMKEWLKIELKRRAKIPLRLCSATLILGKKSLS
jgi:hypothetical protein